MLCSFAGHPGRHFGDRDETQMSDRAFTALWDRIARVAEAFDVVSERVAALAFESRDIIERDYYCVNGETALDAAATSVRRRLEAERRRD